MVCEAELCHYWTGDGCACAVLGLEPEVACGHDPWGGVCADCQDEEA